MGCGLALQFSNCYVTCQDLGDGDQEVEHVVGETLGKRHAFPAHIWCYLRQHLFPFHHFCYVPSLSLKNFHLAKPRPSFETPFYYKFSRFFVPFSLFFIFISSTFFHFPRKIMGKISQLVSTSTRIEAFKAKYGIPRELQCMRTHRRRARFLMLRFLWLSLWC